MRIATSLSLSGSLSLSLSKSHHTHSLAHTHTHSRTLSHAHAHTRLQSSSVEGNMKTPTLEKVEKNAGNEKSSSKELKLEILSKLVIRMSYNTTILSHLCPLQHIQDTKQLIQTWELKI